MQNFNSNYKLRTMNIKFEKKGKEIKNIDDWKLVGFPKRDIQWRKGRSSMEMATFALSDKFKDFIVEVLRSCQIKEQNFICEPEATTSLGRGFGQGGCRNHDLLMIGEDCVIGIEAKVSEPFDKPVEVVFKNQKKDKNKKSSDTRVYKLFQTLCAKEDVETKVENCNFGYQLLTATQGTIQAASKKQKNVILLVIVFKGDVCKESNYENNCVKNDKDFEDFSKALNYSNQDIDLYIRKIDVIINRQYEYKII